MSLANVGPALRAWLVATGNPVQAIAASRVYPIKLKQGEVQPSLVYSVISAQGDHHMGGPSGLARERVQIGSWSVSADTAKALSKAVKLRLDGFAGEWSYGTSSPQEAVTVRGVFFESEREFFDDSNNMYRVVQDYFVNYAER